MRGTLVNRRGVYNAAARDMARRMALAGCSPSQIGPLIREIGEIFGVKVTKEMSRRTVQRCILETLVAADIQLGSEMEASPAFTISQDSTSNRSINYQARHVALRVPNYNAGETILTAGSQHTSRLLRVASTTDHTSQTSWNTWLVLLESTLRTFNNSPLAHRTSRSFSLRQIALKVKGMNTDHASAEKATFDLAQSWKESETVKHLGGEVLTQRDLMDLAAFLNERKGALIESLGGRAAWDGLGVDKQAEHEAEMMEALKEEMGRPLYESLPSDARARLDLFIWAGCCMHKDQNSFKGGADAMAKCWEEIGLSPPILLANKANAAKVRAALNPSRQNLALSDDEAAAIAASTRGGVKTAALAGTLFNNKDDKKGYGDSHVIHLMAECGLSASHRFPDTSNTRFNSHAEAAAELLTYLEFYRRFLGEIKLRKKVTGWTNIEKNVNDALYDVATLTELAAMTLYSQAITHPYLRVVRGSGDNAVNVLDLGPFHHEVREHCQKLIDDPSLLTGESVAFETATLDGRPWDNLQAISAVQEHQKAGMFPHLDTILVAFLKGSQTTWIRFSSEFAPGGTVDTTTASERDLAWMPATNDVNEGALGGYRVHMRDKPSTSLLQFNAQAVAKKNNTVAFMAAVFNDDDFEYIRKVARRWDESGIETKRRAEQVEFEKNLAAIKLARIHHTGKEALERQARLAAVTIVHADEVPKLTIPKLDEQLDALLACWDDKAIPKARAPRGNKANKANLLLEALTRHQERLNEHLSSIIPTEDMTVENWTQGYDELEEEMIFEDEQVF
ncbi:hypothetical protein BKA70DRAFT_1126587 [Coprinopsis sp. MPI-PUGE-AT-0042]|nr:hypothetical protein BKA70DRAFT_1126587 [Coprinopsis sp. MPI-PUGE-AT-0042]